MCACVCLCALVCRVHSTTELQSLTKRLDVLLQHKQKIIKVYRP